MELPRKLLSCNFRGNMCRRASEQMKKTHSNIHPPVLVGEDKYPPLLPSETLNMF